MRNDTRMFRTKEEIERLMKAKERALHEPKIIPSKEVWVKVAMLMFECEEVVFTATPNYPNYHVF